MGKTDDLNITNLECNGEINFDPKNNILKLDKQAKISLPELENLMFGL